MDKERFIWPVRPLACPENTVTGERYRFTVLTDRLLRLEYAADGAFEDRASQKVFYRDFPAVPFETVKEGGTLRLETEKLCLVYTENAPFAADTLTVRLKEEPASAWRFGETYEDLGGTVRTLDGIDGEITLERGLVSRNGFAAIDDSASMLLGKDGWVELRRENTVDAYFFGYGFDYPACVRDFYRLTGAPSLLPAYALGNWWSRYHIYTQEEYLGLMKRFREEDVPFSVGVVDMDWHPVDSVQTPSREKSLPNGWTGFSWNRELFPDPAAFLRELHEDGLHTALNLHPADGVRPHEDRYAAMAKALGRDPEEGKTLLFDVLSPGYMSAYFDELLHPLEDEGVDFWWMDWQQGTNYWWIHEPNQPGEYQDPRERLDPLWMLNHLHILDIARDGKRPMFFSRYSGPGSQRYPVGFSGDTHITWDTLRFQPYFTATASNIGYCWWSHDIGGHMSGYCDGELQARWLQLGVFSPINRLHSTNSHWVQKEPWCYDKATEEIMKKWLRFRHQLFPYLYTMNRLCHDELQPLVQPLYYRYPKRDAAYAQPNQYFFGTELMAAPITEPNDPVSATAGTRVWFPEGEWFDLETGLRYSGFSGRTLEVRRPLDRAAVFAKAGAIVPLAAHTEGENSLGNARQMEVLVFPGAPNVFTLYEDEGEGHDCEKGAFAETQLRLDWGREACFTVAPARGDTSLLPGLRSWKIVLRGFHKAARVTAFVDGKPAEAKAVRDAASNSWEITVSALISSCVEVKITGDELLHDNSDAQDRAFVLIREARLPYNEKDLFWKTYSDAKLTPHRKITRFCGRAPQNRGLEGALRELLLLTEDEFPGQKSVWG